MMSVEEGRIYIENFSRWIAPGSTFIQLANGKMIYFAKMTDKEVIDALKEIMQLEIVCAENRNKNLDH